MSHILETARVFHNSCQLWSLWKSVLSLFHLSSSFFCFSALLTKSGLYLSHVDYFCIFVLVNKNKPKVLTELT